MIEWKVAKSGDKIPYNEGKALASSIDPVREAKTWVKRLKESLYDDTTTVVVLGIGAGYHIEELEKEIDKKIVAIDLFEDFVLEKKSSSNKRYMYIDRPKHYWSNASVNQYIGSKSQIFLHGPSIQTRKSLYFKLRDEINLRNLAAIKNYENNKAALEQVKQVQLKENSGLLSLKEMVDSIPQKNNTQEVSKWKILREFLR